MTYDSPDFRVQMMHGPIKGSFSSVLYTVAQTNVKTITNEDDLDKVEFFRNVKLLDFKVMPIIAPTAGTLAAGSTVKYKLYVGSDVVATAAVVSTSTAVGSMVEGGIASGTLAEVSSNEEVEMKLVYTSGAGTDNTLVTTAVNAFILYEHRFA
jgi:hypothetical protein